MNDISFYYLREITAKIEMGAEIIIEHVLT